MNKLSEIVLLFAICLLSMCGCKSESDSRLVLWYEHPATRWVEALPLGNGRLGAMVYGDPVHEEFQLNEETIWAGSPHNNTNSLAKDALSRIRRLIFNGKNKEAQELCGQVICSTTGQGMPYQTVGSLHLDFDIDTTYTDYYRELDIDRAVATTRFTSADGVTFTREAFTSFTDQLLIIRLTASHKNSISFTAHYTTPFTDNVELTATADNQMQLSGKADDHEGIEGKVKFTSITRIDCEGGTQSMNNDGSLTIQDADTVTLYVSIGTNFVNYQDVSGDAQQAAEAFIAHANSNYKQALQTHTAAYQKYFSRVSLDLGTNEQALKPTDQRVREFAEQFDPQMVALYFQFGRYLLICSSQPGGQAANLQGIWNYQLRAPWDGKYTTDINVEMNYWPAEVTAIPEMHEPFLQLIKECAIQGRESAAMYGCRGWTLHHNTDIWRSTGAVDGAGYAVWPTCNAWFCQHLWDRYLFSGDQDYLAEVYPIMRAACKFYLDFLINEPKNNWLVVAPSYSPENRPVVNGKRDFVVVAGTTMDNQMVSDLFRNTLAAGALMNESQAFTDSLHSVVSQLAPMQVGRWGQLQEWMEDWDNPDDHHRHTSHLWGLYPGRQISAYRTPELFEAAKNTLNSRGDHSTGWSMGWKVCLWARLLDGNHAYKLITEQMNPTTEEKGQNGGTYPNLFDAHPPFQIDGNFGCTAGIAEMMVQSHDGAVHLMPAIPDVWAQGTVRGLRCRGGFTLDEMTWHEGRLRQATITSTIGGVLRIRSAVPLSMNGIALEPTEDECANPLLQPQGIRKPVIAADAPLTVNSQPETFVYDVETRAGQTIVFAGN